jgi:hypothetical protein
MVTATNHTNILKSMKMLDSMLFMFNEKHVEEKWYANKIAMLFD